PCEGRTPMERCVSRAESSAAPAEEALVTIGVPCTSGQSRRVGDDRVVRGSVARIRLETRISRGSRASLVRVPLTSFSPPVRIWFEQAFAAPTPAQAQAWPAIAAGENVLVSAPTGSGKTLAAFLWALDRLSAEGVDTDPPAGRTRVVYISPLKALAYDIERNLRAPLRGIDAEDLRVAIRTGDTPQRERAAMLRNPPDILVTTPESLYLMLTSRAREMLTGVEAVIVDEIHAVAHSKRGAHLAL